MAERASASAGKKRRNSSSHSQRGTSRPKYDRSNKFSENKSKFKKGSRSKTEAEEDSFHELANKSWSSPQTKANKKVISDVFEELVAQNFPVKRIGILESSQYLENLLLPTYSADSDSQHAISVVVLVLAKFLEGVSPLRVFEATPEVFVQLFDRVASMLLEDESLAPPVEAKLLQFLTRCLQALEVDFVRQALQPYIGLCTWRALSEFQRESLFKEHPKLRKGWRAIHKKRAKLPEEEQNELIEKDMFFARLVQQFLSKAAAADPQDRGTKALLERYLELFVDLEALLTTRRYLNTIMNLYHVVPRCQQCPLAISEETGHLFRQLLEMLRFYVSFEIDDFTGEQLTDHEMLSKHYGKVKTLQQIAFRNFEELKEFALSNVSNIDRREDFVRHLEDLDDQRLEELCVTLALLPKPEELNEDASHPLAKLNADAKLTSRQVLVSLLASQYERRYSQLESLNGMPLYPTEQTLWDENIVPTEHYVDECLALPKLQSQFLTLFDYLLRNLNLFNMEAMYEIRMDIEEHIPRLKPIIDEESNVNFSGWSRMAQPVSDFSIVEVAKAHVGESHPAVVRADVSVNLDHRQSVRDEWQKIKRYDVAFLVTVRPPYEGVVAEDAPFAEKYGIVAVRGCEIEGMLDADGHLIDDRPDAKPKFPKGTERTFRVMLDPNQYQLDLDASSSSGIDVHGTFNVLLRRDPRENNFKAVLETIRDLMNAHCVVPDWLHDIVLGYGDPASAHYSNLPNVLNDLDFCDTFLDQEHLKASFPDNSIKFEAEDLKPPFRLKLPIKPKTDDSFVPRQVKKSAKTDKKESKESKEIVASSYDRPSRGPYPQNVPKANGVRFTATQVEAIKSGMQPGLTVVVGPPGTGKTDVAVQIISNLYHNFPQKRTLIVTHSNQALNQLFEKIIALDIEEKHLLRLGRGEELLDTTGNFSRHGRVNFILEHRLFLLTEVRRLSQSVGGADTEFTCDTATSYHKYHVQPKWTSFFQTVTQEGYATSEIINQYFPFHSFFANAPTPLFVGDYEQDLEKAKSCQRYLEDVFNTLGEYRAFELLHRHRDRTKYLLVKESRIVAMTCTHAALTRKDLIDQCFEYDNVVMEEAGQILEIETFVPLLLQKPQNNRNRLQRVILIGDHHQLPPVIRNPAFKKFCNMEQSMFSRLIRLGVPHVLLDAQGRMRPQLADLYRWRYKDLKDLPHVAERADFQRANPGFVNPMQLIDVEDFQGVGEVIPSPHFVQNLGEAEYVVAVYMYMRLLGYPAEKITLLTTYNGQKALIRDVVKARCLSHPLFGAPHMIETVDKYQGSQNDYVLLSLVRTRSVGFLRDIRRLIVAMSRARLGLYVFCRQELFQSCKELQPVFEQFKKLPNKLQLYPNEVYGSCERAANDTSEDHVEVETMEHMAQSVYNMAVEKVKELHEQNKKAQEEQAKKQKEEEEAAKPEEQQQVFSADNDTSTQENEVTIAELSVVDNMQDADQPEDFVKPAEEQADMDEKPDEAAEDAAEEADKPPAFTEDDIMGMKVKELNDSIRSLGATPIKGRKNDLQKQLRELS